MLLQKGVASPQRKNATGHTMDAPGCEAADREPMLLDAEREERERGDKRGVRGVGE
jgi:hypothetical protein